MNPPATISPNAQPCSALAQMPRSPSPLTLDDWDMDDCDLDPEAWAGIGELSSTDLLHLLDDAETCTDSQQERQLRQQERLQATAYSTAGSATRDTSAETSSISPVSDNTDCAVSVQVFPNNSSMNVPDSTSRASHGDYGSDTCKPHASPHQGSTSTSWCTTSSSEDSDDGNSSSCTVHNAAACSSPEPTVKAEENGGGVVLSAIGSSLGAAGSSTCKPQNDLKNGMAVRSGAGNPILPFAFTPGFGSVGSGNPLTSAAMSALPHFGHLAFAAASGWRRLRGDEGAPEITAEQTRQSDSQGQGTGAGHNTARGPTRLLSSRTRSRTQDSGCSNIRVNKRAKREERLLKNREAANRSRMKRKEVLNELESTVASLSGDLAVSREENAELKHEIASLREQNSFLRGMLSANGSNADLPPILPTCHKRSSTNASGSGGGGGGASAVVDAIGTALAVVSCVAMSAAGFGGSPESKVHVPGADEYIYPGEMSRGGGRRMLLSVDEHDLVPTMESGTCTSLRCFLPADLMQFAGSSLLLVLAIMALLFISRNSIRTVVQRVESGGASWTADACRRASRRKFIGSRKLR